MPDVIIDGVRYVPAVEVPELADDRLAEAVRELVGIQYFAGETHKHRAWAWDALNALAPELAELCAQDPDAAWDLMNPEETPDAL